MFDKEKKINFQNSTIIFFIIAFVLMVYCAIRFDPLNVPDEPFRMTVPYFIYEHNILPIGNETVLRNEIWGFSYAIYPYLPSLIGVFFMKIASVIGVDLHVALRFVSVISIIGTMFMCLKIGKEIFKKDSTALLFSVLCVFLPQVIFLGSYLNNDAFSIFLSSIIIFSWIKGLKSNWPYKICILLGIALGCMALTYYNAYGYILCTIPIFCISFYKENKGDWNSFIKKGGIIFIIAFLISGWFFIRNAIHFNGDFFGRETCRIHSELYGNEMGKPSNRKTPSNLNYSFYETFFIENEISGSNNWIKNTWFSFIGVFGNMSVNMSEKIYMFYTALIGGGAIISLYPIKKLFDNFSLKKILENKNFNKILFLTTLVMVIIIPIILSMIYTFYTDYQSQGRYIISALLPLMIFVTIGIKFLFNKINSTVKKDLPLDYILMDIYLFIFLIVYLKYIIIS